MNEIGRDTRITVVAKTDIVESEDVRVLRVVRESLRMDPPVVRFEAASKRCLGFFH